MKKLFYRVQQGDCLQKISDRLGVPKHFIIKLNNLSKEVADGDLLYIEQLDFPTYAVGVTDTVESIAKKFGVDEEVLLQLNGLEYVYMGQIIYLPK